ncbi:hypothetical protein DTO282E5_3624 [Paecilomyces variotii]|nr:hypothetical protein DTO282E5_3624 [Paecilomyces variotii]
MGQITLDGALLLLSSDKQKERTDGLGDLKHILQQNKQNARLDALSDKACHKVFEALFRFVSVEKPTYNRSKSTKATSSSRLSACASVLRTAVEGSLRNLRTKSVHAVLHHIIQTIPVPGEGLWETLASDYIKCLRTLLQYPPHVEHLGDREWQDAVDFCLRSLAAVDNEGNELSIRMSHRSSSEAWESSSTRLTPMRRTSSQAPRLTQSDGQGNRGIIEELVICIKLLTSSSNAPVHSTSEKILNGLTDFLISFPQAGGAHQAAFSTINTIIGKVLCDQSDIVREFLLDVIPVIRRLWQTKLTGLKDEMLMTIMRCMDVLVYMARTMPSESLAASIEGLLDTIHLDYLRRTEKEVLQIDDLVFYPDCSIRQDSRWFGPRLGSYKSEHNWTVLWTIARLSALSDDMNAQFTRPVADEVPSKRQRSLSKTEEILQDSFSSTGTRRACALQLIPFMIERHIGNASKLELLERLPVNILDDNGFLASWTLLAISSVGSDSYTRSHLIGSNWRQIWDLASRASVVQVTSRAACHLMRIILHHQLLPYPEAVESTRLMLSSVDLKGPSVLCDTSLAFWTLVSKMCATVSPGLGLEASKQICGWLRGTWSVGTATDRTTISQVATFARPFDLLNLLLACTNRSISFSSVEFRGVAGSFGRNWFNCHHNRSLHEFLFSVGEDQSSNPVWSAEETVIRLEAATRQDPADLVMIELLQAKIDAFAQAWRELSGDKSFYIAVDLVQIFVSLCAVAVLFTECLPGSHGSQLQDLQKSTRSLWEDVCLFLASREVDYLQAGLEVLYPLVSSAPQLNDSKDVVSSALYALVPPIVEVLERSRQSQPTDSLALDPESMDLDDPFSDRMGQEAADDSITALNREAVPTLPDNTTFRRFMTIRLSIFQKGDGTISPNPTLTAPLVEYLTSLDETDILSTQDLLPKVFLACIPMGRAVVLEILEYFGERCLQSYALERCESALYLCIRMMGSFVDVWTKEEEDDLHDSASDIYIWFTDVLLARRKASPRVLIALAELFQSVLASNPGYERNDSGPSPRTSLFNILREGDISVKFFLARLVPSIFSRYLLTDHDAIFDDVLDSLPRDPDWTEGIAVRLYALAQLASRWHTLLRRSIYHMFEAPGQVPQSAPYAEKCLKNVSDALGLKDAKGIFRLFASQIIYTWTESQSISSMPFTIFGYSSLKDMLLDVQDEVVGQIMMRANDQEASEASVLLGVPFTDLLSESFHKAEAYTIARDISIPPSQNSQPNGVEKRIKSTLGTDQFITLVEGRFPQIVATLFRSLDKEEQIEKAFTKRAHFHYALETLKRIMDKGASAAILPANPQPSFRARYLLDELEFLCRRSGYDLEKMWTPALASFVCRTLLESMHPSLGSLYACSVIRKIRILVCIAGPVMLQDYPLELCLHALCPLLTDSQCCEDALGVFWYLLEAGQAYLSENPGFTAGIAILTLSSLSNFLDSSAESASQESQYRATSSKAVEFRNWLGSFLKNYKASSMDEGTEESFQRMVRSSQGLRVSGNPTKGTHESDLLFELLQDRTSGRNLLSRPISDLVISLVGARFQKSPDSRSDILGEDDVAAANAVAVWETVRSGNPGSQYRLWAARVIGRAYASTGKISDALLREQDPDLFKDRFRGLGSDPYSSSKIAILQMLCEALPKGGALEGGLIERTLQVIISKLSAYPELEHCGHAVPSSLMKSLIWDPYQCPAISLSSSEIESLEGRIDWDNRLSVSHWARNIALSLATAAADDPVIGPLGKVLYWIPELSVRLLPYILHDVLLSEVDGDQVSRRAVSEVFRRCLRDIDERSVPHARLVINTILYLRNQPKPHESTIVDRDEWLDIDYCETSLAATRCRMYKTSLLFAEIQASRSMKTSRRSSAVRQSLPIDLLHDIFRNIDDPDSFYGIQQEASLRSVMEKLDYESAGIKNLLFQSAQYDSDVQMSGEASAFSVIKALNSTNLQGLASAMLSSPAALKRTSAPFESMLSTAMSLQQWDIPVPSSKTSPTGVLFKTFQGLSTSESSTDIPKLLDESFVILLDHLGESNQSVTSLRSVMKALGILTEVDEVLCSSSSAQIEDEWEKITSREKWFKWESFHDIDQILHCREALFSLMSHKDHLRSSLKLSLECTNLLQAKVIKESLSIARDHQIPQASLRYAISLSKLAQVCDDLGVNIDGSAKFDLANVLWDQGEMTTSIQMLQQVNDQNDLHKQAIPVSRALLLSSLGHHVAEARLEKPEAIIQEYLVPAVKELKSNLVGEEPGRVFHVFAAFCDQQLQNPDGLEDFKRVEQLRDRKEKEVIALEKMMKTAEGRERETLKMHRTKAKQWFELDDRDYQRLKKGREAFLQQCLENYLLCLKASDTHNNDALRFCALWLDNSDSQIANTAVSKYISQVPSRKFAPLMNQLSSRLLDVPNEFQTTLFALLFRICVEHPYHGMYQIFASSKSKAGKDETSVARHQAAGKLVDKLKNDRHAGSTWVAIHNTNISYVRFAIDRPDEKIKTGAKVPLKKLATGQRLEQDATNLKLPPPTMRIELRVDCNYKDVPKVVRFHPEFTVASGVSAPKIVTAIASDGQRYKQLVKGGNDDLRQDAIMEQVFEQVSNLLKDHRATQQRGLGIRTYKVLPLTSNAGIIEFVPNTIPLHDYLMPAHQRYFPKDMKPNACRKHISDVQTRSFEQRVRTFRQVTDHFHPVMRFFFMEKFNNPDDWFCRRLAYTRSTAAISILGYVLGLGDRHGHNILLDEKTGEVVHIDLGVAFEQGRVLPVPEVVPFRLTRDLVDGMGITKTEGVFRRCCEFTLEALREESYSIMTILDVLRYDPLYSWTVSPLRMKRMQETQEAGGGAPQLPIAAGKGTGNEPSEADRALTIVEKKLSKTLSVTATVNELIQQATDERNLAVLYCGWAAYA